MPWARQSSAVGDDLKHLRRGAFAYRTYDCVAGSGSPRLEPVDVLVADGLNAQLRTGDIAGVLAVADAVSGQLDRIDKDLNFWELSREDLAAAPANHDSPAWAMWRAWTILTGVHGIDVARAHKILHHKRPAVFPLLDNKTVQLLDRPTWAAIHDDLKATGSAWAGLEGDVAKLVTRARKKQRPLTRLRLHDILLWTRAPDRWDIAYRYGGSYVSHTEP